MDFYLDDEQRRGWDAMITGARACRGSACLRLRLRMCC